MSWTVYILYRKKDKQLYVGCTSDVEKRLKKNLSGQVLATAHRKPFVLIHTESFLEKGKAFQKERFLKSLWGSREKKKILAKYIRG